MCGDASAYEHRYRFSRMLGGCRMPVTMTTPEVAKIPQTDEDAPLALIQALSNPPRPRDQPQRDDAEPWDHPSGEDGTDDSTRATRPAEAVTHDREEGDTEERAHNNEPPLSRNGDRAWSYGGLCERAEDIIGKLDQFHSEGRDFLEDIEVLSFLQ